jgi:hypothetical protein
MRNAENAYYRRLRRVEMKTSYGLELSHGFLRSHAKVPCAAILVTLTLTAFLTGCPQSSENLWYVRVGASGDGSSWSDAFGSIQDAINAAAKGGGGEVWTASGTYTAAGSPVATLAAGVALYGGFAGDEKKRSERDWTANETIIDGASSIRCVYAIQNGTLDGFVIQNGYATQGGGMYARSCSPTVTNCVFRYNKADDSGGGLCMASALPDISGCEFNSNSSGVDGGGVSCLESSKPSISSCSFALNEAETGGGLANLDDSAPTLTSCIFTENVATQGGGVFISLAEASFGSCAFIANDADEGGGVYNDCVYETEFSDCFFNANSADFGGGMLNRSATPKISACAFNGNTATSAGAGMANDSNSDIQAVNSLFIGNSTKGIGGGVYNDFSGLTLFNCVMNANTAAKGGAVCGCSNSNLTALNAIFWGDSASESSEIYNESTDFSFSIASVTYSCIEGGIDGDGNIGDDPLFEDAANGNYRLAENSPCVDAGTDVDLNVDRDGVGRPQGDGYDMGAYESAAK